MNSPGRTPDLAALHQWRTTDRKIAARCLTGRAGAGKTRLAIDFCEQAEAAGWHSGFLQHASLPLSLRARVEAKGALSPVRLALRLVPPVIDIVVASQPLFGAIEVIGGL